MFPTPTTVDPIVMQRHAPAVRLGHATDIAPSASAPRVHPRHGLWRRPPCLIAFRSSQVAPETSFHARLQTTLRLHLDTGLRRPRALRRRRTQQTRQSVAEHDRRRCEQETWLQRGTDAVDPNRRGEVAVLGVERVPFADSGSVFG